jgi:phage-related baseplate assembly protein
LPAPEVIEPLDYETILAGLKADMVARFPEIATTLELESEPAVKLLEVVAYAVLLLRARVNDAAKSVMLAHATGGNLDNLAALLGVARLVVSPADPAAVPPVAAVMETDAALRLRAQLALEGYTSAGSVGSYEFHARTADARVIDVSVLSPEPGTVQVTVLSSEADGTPSPELLGLVLEALNAEEVRPLCDSVVVQAPTIVDYSVAAELHVADGPDTTMVLQAAQAAVEAYVADVHALGATVAISGLHAALHQAGVTRVVLTAPVAEVETTPVAAPWCTAINLTLGGTP